MKVAILLCLSLPLGALAQPLRGTAGFLRPVDDSLFHSCGKVESRALELASSISDQVYFMELYPMGGKSLFHAFFADGGIEAKFKWLTEYDVNGPPYALFYFVNGAYALRCRDDLGHFFELAGPKGPSKSARPGGDPFELAKTPGQTVIWHFFLTPINVAHVFVVSQTPLQALDGEELIAQVQERLAARYVFLYVRNDPWFFGYASDSIPFIFADSSKEPTEEQYRATETMVCITGNGGCTVRTSPR
jgi:hypothetical protein